MDRLYRDLQDAGFSEPLSRKMTGMANTYIEEEGLDSFRKEYPDINSFVKDAANVLLDNPNYAHYVMEDPHYKELFKRKEGKEPKPSPPSLPRPQKGVPPPPKNERKELFRKAALEGDKDAVAYFLKSGMTASEEKELEKWARADYRKARAFWDAKTEKELKDERFSRLELINQALKGDKSAINLLIGIGLFEGETEHKILQRMADKGNTYAQYLLTNAVF